MLYTVDQLRATLRTDLRATFDEIAAAKEMAEAHYAVGKLHGRLLELERMGVLHRGELQGWLADAAIAASSRRRELESAEQTETLQRPARSGFQTEVKP